MTKVDAIFRDGVFQPLGPVPLNENERVQLSVERLRSNRMQDWLKELQELHATIIARVGVLPDSAPDIAEDRRR